MSLDRPASLRGSLEPLLSSLWATSLGSLTGPADAGEEWGSFSMTGQKESGTKKPGRVAIGPLARRLMARERARGRSLPW